MNQKIKLVRYMSECEFETYLDGLVLENHTAWRLARGNSTNSVGFCFFPVPEDGKVEKLMEILTGIAVLEKVVIMETDVRNVRMSYGRYRDAAVDNPTVLEMLINPLGNIPTIRKIEYCTEEYSLENFVPLKVGKVLDPFRRRVDWYWRTGAPAVLN